MTEIKFVTFGCWNSKLCGDNDNPVSFVTKALKIFSEEEKINYLIVTGDNYYPIKNKNINLTQDDTDVVNPKIINKTILESGFNCLPNIPTYLLWGNHDLDNSNKKLRVYNGVPSSLIDPFDKTIANVNDPALLVKQAQPCSILNLEMDYASQIKQNIIKFPGRKLVMTKYDENTNTFILMLDTTMYSIGKKDKNDVLTCYKKILGVSDIDLQGIKDIQEHVVEEIIRDEILPNYRIENLIIVGHHPLFCVKRKEENESINDTLDGIPSIYGLLYNKINTPLKRGGRNLNYYYLCADLHSYQNGTLRINGKNGQESMLLEEYIVGTGGTKLDPILKNNGNRTEEFRDDESNVLAIYEMHTNEKTHGFLECSLKLAGPPVFNFIPVETPETIGKDHGENVGDIGGGVESESKRKKRNFSIKKKKTIKRSKKEKKMSKRKLTRKTSSKRTKYKGNKQKY
jgi:hypothetical protein